MILPPNSRLSRRADSLSYNNIQETTPNLRVQMPRHLKHLNNMLSNLKNLKTVLTDSLEEPIKITTQEFPKVDPNDLIPAEKPRPRTSSFVYKNPYEHKSLRAILAFSLDDSKQVSPEPISPEKRKQYSSTERPKSSFSRDLTNSTVRLVENYHFVSYQKQEIPTVEPKAREPTRKISGPARFIRVIQRNIAAVSSNENQLGRTGFSRSYSSAAILNEGLVNANSFSETKIKPKRAQTALRRNRSENDIIRNTGIANPDEIENIVKGNLRNRVNEITNNLLKRSLSQPSLKNSRELNSGAASNKQAAIGSYRRSLQNVPSTSKKRLVRKEDRGTFANFFHNSYIDAAIITKTFYEEDQISRLGKIIEKRKESIKEGNASNDDDPAQNWKSKELTMMRNSLRNELKKRSASQKDIRQEAVQVQEEYYSPPRYQIYSIAKEESPFFSIKPLVADRYLQRAGKKQSSKLRDQKESAAEKELKDVIFLTKDEEDIPLKRNKKGEWRRLLEPLLQFLRRMERLKLSKDEVSN